MLQLKNLLVLLNPLILIVQAHAQSSATAGGLSLPACAINCLETAISNDGCIPTDFSCHCSRASEFVAEIETCVLQQCSLSGQDFGNAFVQECASLSGITVSVPPVAAATTAAASEISSAAASSTASLTSISTSSMSTTTSSILTTTAETTAGSLGLPPSSITSHLTSSVSSTTIGAPVFTSSTIPSSSVESSKDIASPTATLIPTTTYGASATTSGTTGSSSAPSSTGVATLVLTSPSTSTSLVKTTIFIPITIPTKLSSVTNPSVLVSFFIQSAILSTLSMVPPRNSVAASITTPIMLAPLDMNGTTTGTSTGPASMSPDDTGTQVIMGSSTPSLNFSSGQAPGGLSEHCFGLVLGMQLLLAVLVLQI